MAAPWLLQEVVCSLLDLNCKIDFPRYNIDVRPAHTLLVDWITIKIRDFHVGQAIFTYERITTSDQFVRKLNCDVVISGNAWPPFIPMAELLMTNDQLVARLRSSWRKLSSTTGALHRCIAPHAADRMNAAWSLLMGDRLSRDGGKFHTGLSTILPFYGTYTSYRYHTVGVFN